VFRRLLSLSEDDVMRIAAFFMARSLQPGSDAVEEAGVRLSVDARASWQPDETFFDLIRDRATINAVLADVAGEDVARANIAEKAKTQRLIVRDCLEGANGRVKVEGWLPGWLAFPARNIGQRVQPDVQPPVAMAAE
jgi:ParB family chromosome partitioning protein